MIGRLFLNRYEAIRLLGEGGMGKVYLARQTDLGRQVVVKVMHEHIAADPKFRERFQRETLVMARFQHPYAVTLFDASLTDPAGMCIVMEYIKGVGLDEMLSRDRRFSPGRVGRLVGQLGEVLQAAHDEKIIHRDLKPANLMMVDADSPREKIKVLDFGLAKPVATGPEGSRVSAEFAVGTPGYISPEEIQGHKVDHRADLYSLGVILYELLAGRAPFTGQTAMDLMLAHVNEEPPTFADLGVDDWVPEAVEDLIRELLAKNPLQRPQSARDVAERYDLALHKTYSAAKLPPAAPVQTPTAMLPTFEPDSIVHTMEAWMPETIALMKICGLVQDLGGEITESAPGRVRVRLGTGPGRKLDFAPVPSAFSWLGFGRRSSSRQTIDLILHLVQIDPKRANKLQIAVQFLPGRGQADDPSYKRYCNSIFCEVRGYLMGQTADVG